MKKKEDNNIYIKILIQLIINLNLIAFGWYLLNCYQYQAKLNQEKLQIFNINIPSQQVRPYDQYLYTWWTDKHQLSKNRLKNLNKMQNCKLSVVFITLQTLPQLVLEDHPLHPAIQNISAIQIGDYLKGYFMHIYGGGYADLKPIKQSFQPGRDKLRQNIDLLGVGYYEKQLYHVGFDPADISFIQYLGQNQNYKKYIGNGQYVFKPMSQFTLEWYNRMVDKMQQKKQLLKIYPAKSSRQIQWFLYPYPIRWQQLNGQIFAKVQFKYPRTVSDGIPYVITSNYL